MLGVGGGAWFRLWVSGWFLVLSMFGFLVIYVSCELP